MGEALCHAHSLGIIHRDVKPENVMVRKDGVLKLMDFGVAQVVDLERMTVTGQILGSPAYMAPEVLDGRTLDFRSDVFSVGVMLYQMATGVLPFTGKNPHEVLRRVSEGTLRRSAHGEPPGFRPTGPGHRARAGAQPEDRYPTLAEMLDELRGYTTDAGLTQPREELRQYLTEPEEYEKGLVGRMVLALVASGFREQAAKHRARALELWNRALAFEPDNQAVLTELRRLERGERLRRWFIGGTVLAVLVGMATGAFFLARKALSERAPVDRRDGGRSRAPAARRTGREDRRRCRPPRRQPGRRSRCAARPAASAHATREARRAASEKAKPRSRTAATIRAGESITLTLGFTPARVEVWMDGKKAFDFGPLQNRIQIPWNKPHRLEFRNDSCCNRKEVVVGPQLFRPPGDHLFVKLDPKPARLQVLLEPPIPGASLLVRELNDAKAKPWHARALPGEKVLVPFDPGDEMRKSLEVVVFKGDKTTTNQVTTITAGETRPVTIHVDD